MSRSERIQRRKARAAVDKDVEVVVANLTHGTFSYEAPNNQFSLSLDEFGDDDFLTFEQLRVLKKQLENFTLLIVEVTTPGVELYDVIQGLHLTKQYKDYFKYVEEVADDEIETIDYLDPQAIEDFIEDAEADDFEKSLKSRIKSAVIETAVAMYKEGELNDHYKIVDIQNTRPKGESEDFWRDIDASLE